MWQSRQEKLKIFCAHMVDFCRPGHICWQSIKFQRSIVVNTSLHVKYNKTLTVQCKKVNEVFATSLQSFTRGKCLWSYNEFVGSHSGVNFVIPYYPFMLCRDLFFVSASQSALQMSASGMWNSCTSWAIREGCEVLIKMLTFYQLTFSHINHTTSNMKTL